MDKLSHLFDLQTEFQQRFFDFKSMTEEQKQLMLVDFLGHLQEEIAEVRQELPYRKHWKRADGKPCDRRKLGLELVDCFHFLINSMLVFGFTADEVYEIFLKKHDINILRQDVKGYGYKPKKN